MILNVIIVDFFSILKQKVLLLNWFAIGTHKSVGCSIGENGDDPVKTNLEALKFILDLGIPINSQDEYGETALLQYARMQMIEDGEDGTCGERDHVFPHVAVLLERGA